MSVQDHQRFVINSPVPEVNPNTKESAEKRQEKIDRDVAEYLARGGEVLSLPAYDVESK